MRIQCENTQEYVFSNLASEYDAWFDKEGSLIFAIEVKAFCTILRQLPKPWLEIGVGSGRFAQELGIETGINPSANLLKIAKRRGIRTSLGRGEQSLFDAESFGTVFLIVTLCFLDSPLDVLREVNRILMPGSKLVLGLVLKESPWGQFYRVKKAEGHRFYKYATFYSFDEVARFIAQTGFIIEKIVSTLVQAPAAVRYAEEPREGYLRDAGFTVIVAEKLDNWNSPR